MGFVGSLGPRGREALGFMDGNLSLDWCGWMKVVKRSSHDQFHISCKHCWWQVRVRGLSLLGLNNQLITLANPQPLITSLLITVINLHVMSARVFPA
jgi:hypothetical protein